MVTSCFYQRVRLSVSLCACRSQSETIATGVAKLVMHKVQHKPRAVIAFHLDQEYLS